MVRRSASGTYSYERKRRFDRKGRRWHFVYHSLPTDVAEYRERPYEVLFRNDERTDFGQILFERPKDNPYRDFDALVTKIMNESKFRASLRDPASEELWLHSWK